MSEEDTINPAAAPRPRRSRAAFAAAALGLLAAGGVAGAGVTAFAVPREKAVLIQPVAVSAMRDDTDVAVKGNVAEIFGNKFVIADGSGRALVETGPRGEGGDLVKPGEALTVQGRFDGGFIRGQLLVRADGSAETLKPPHPGPRGWAERLHGRDVPVADATPRP